MLQGSHDNYTGNPHNTERWKSYKEQLALKEDVVTFDEMKEIATYYTGLPDSITDGDIYNSYTQTVIVLDLESARMEIFFRNDDSYPQNPLPLTPEFVEIPDLL